MKVKKIYNDVYGQLFVFAIQEHPDEVFNKYGINIPSQSSGKCVSNEEFMIIAVGTDEIFNTIAHECYHAIEFLWDERGIEKIQGTDEAFAYMVGWLTNKCLDFFIKQTSDE